MSCSICSLWYKQNNFLPLDNLLTDCDPSTGLGMTGKVPLLSFRAERKRTTDSIVIPSEAQMDAG